MDATISSAKTTYDKGIKTPFYKSDSLSLTCRCICLSKSARRDFANMQVLLDIGAGQGLFSLAAAARGHKAIAFELSAKSLASLEASVAFSSLHHLVDVHKVILCTIDIRAAWPSCEPAL